MTVWLRHISLFLMGLAVAGGVGAQPEQHSSAFDRDWTVFIVPFSHTDVGFTDPVPVVVENHHRYLDSVLVYIEQTEDYPAGSRFKWTIEIPWVLEGYLESRSPGEVERLMSRVRAGDIEIGALHVGLQTDLASPEELVRSLYCSHALRETYDVPVRTAVLNDTPGFTWSLAQLLPRSGVPYLSVAMNAELSEFYATSDLPHLFFWEAQTGDRTLVWRSIHDRWAYLEGAIWGAYGDFADFEARLVDLLTSLADSGYPHDAILINAATGDNGPPNPSIVENVRMWNETNHGAEIRISTFSEFFDHAGERFDGEIPVFSGDAPNWWSWSFAASATGGFLRSRVVQNLLPVAEAFASVASRISPNYSYPGADLRRAYENGLLYVDHNMGGLTPAADAEFWPRKMAWIDDAHSTATSVLEGALDAWSKEIETAGDPVLAVFNPSPWPRTDIAVFDPVSSFVTPAFEIRDMRNEEVVPHQVLSDGTVAFLARDVSALGYTSFHLSEVAETDSTPDPVHRPVLENADYRIQMDPSTGGIASLIDKSLDRELAAPAGRFSEYLYNSSQSPSGMAVVARDSGAVLQRVVMRGAAPGSNWYEAEVVLPAGLHRVDVHHRYDKRPPTSFEGVDFRFDFALPAPELTYEIPFGHVRVFEDELSGFRSRHYAARSWFGISSGDATWHTILATSGPSVHAHAGETFTGDLRLVTSFNTAGTAYRAGVGELAASFSLTSGEGRADASVAARFGDDQVRPMHVRLLPPGQTGTLPSSASMLELDERLSLVALKRSEVGDALIARLFNPSADVVEATLSTGLDVRSIDETTPVEVVSGAIASDEGAARLTFQPYEIRTLRLDVPSATRRGANVLREDAVLLDQNFPNPFMGETRIRYFLDRPSLARLAVHDLLGRLVAIIDQEMRAPGWHTVSWDGTARDGRALASGIYFYTLSTSEGGRPASTRKLVLVR